MLSGTKLQSILTKDDYQNISFPEWPTWETIISMENVPDEIERRINLMIEEVEQSQQQSKMFCALAFHGREYRIYPGFSGLTCSNATHEELKNIQHKMLLGQPSVECRQRCWATEEKNIESLRQVHNKTLDHLLNRSISNLYQECLTHTNYPTYIYKIESSNLCNSTCVTCSGKFSTAWQQLEKKNNQFTIDYIKFDVTGDHLTLDSESINHAELFPIDYKNAKMINFLGGEPTLEKNNFKILENLISANNTDCLVSFTTHGNFNLTDYQLQIVKQFPNIQFNYSIDGIESRFEYIRYPLKWNKLLDNIDWCRSNNIEISANITISNLNIFYFKELKDWLTKEKLNYTLTTTYNHKLTTHHNVYSVTALPLHIKSIIIKRCQDEKINRLLSSHTEQDDNNYQLFLQDISTQDQWKNIKIDNYLPEFANCIHDDLLKITNTYTTQ